MDPSTLRIPVLLGTTRTGRKSEAVARFVLHHLQAFDGIETELIDLRDVQLPVMEERISHVESLSPELAAFNQQMKDLDGLIIVTPEYKNGIPGALKNAFDYLDGGIFKRKPIGISTVSSGGFGGINCLAQLRLVVLAMGGIPTAEKFPISKVNEAFDDNGTLLDESLSGKVQRFLEEVVWLTNAVNSMHKG